MVPYEIATNVGKLVSVTRGQDLYMDVGLRPVLNKRATLVKQTRGGLLYLEFEGRHYAIPMSAVNAIPADESPTITMTQEWVGETGPLNRSIAICVEEAFKRLLWKEMYDFGLCNAITFVDNETITVKRMQHGLMIKTTFKGSLTDMHPLAEAAWLYRFFASVKAEETDVEPIKLFGRGMLAKTPEDLVSICGSDIYIGGSLLQNIAMGLIANADEDLRLHLIDHHIEKVLYLASRHVFHGAGHKALRYWK